MKKSEKMIDNIESGEKEDKKEKKELIKKFYNICQLCSKKYTKNPNIKCIHFNNCDHEICYICLYKILIRSKIKSISQIFSLNNKLKINCICELGSTDLSIQEIISILISLNKEITNTKPEKIENFLPKEKKCEMHDITITKFCMECYELICDECINEHNRKIKNSYCNHKTVPYNELYMKLYSNLEEIPNLNIILDKNNFEENFYKKYSELISIKFENLINEINYIKENILNSLKKEYEKYKLSMEAIYLLYKYYYYELTSINKETDIDQLMFLYNTNIFFPELNYKFSEAEAETILNQFLKKLNETKFDNMFEFKFKSINAQPYKCVQIIPDIHPTNITSICNLYNYKFVSADFEGNIKIWKNISNRYILSQEMKKVYQGAVNQICAIKLNKFAICSQSSKNICIYQEDINTEKFILIQEIKLNKPLSNEENSGDKKYFNKITTLNDKNSLLATTSDNYIYIFQDKIGGIPKQNYMKTNYELVESFDAFHSKGINSILHTKTENIITASEDGTIKVWNKERKYSTLIGHEDSVNIIEEIDKKYIVSGGSDGIIIIWEFVNNDIDNNKYILKQKLFGHEFSVIGLVYLNDDRLISASIDDTIKIWQRNKFEMFINKITIKEQKLGIEGLVNIDNETLLTYSGNKSINIWKVSKKEELFDIKKIENIQNNVVENKKKEIIKRTESVDYMVKNTIKEMTEEENKKEEIKKDKIEEIREDKREEIKKEDKKEKILLEEKKDEIREKKREEIRENKKEEIKVEKKEEKEEEINNKKEKKNEVFEINTSSNQNIS